MDDATGADDAVSATAAKPAESQDQAEGSQPTPPIEAPADTSDDLAVTADPTPDDPPERTIAAALIEPPSTSATPATATPTPTESAPVAAPEGAAAEADASETADPSETETETAPAAVAEPADDPDDPAEARGGRSRGAPDAVCAAAVDLARAAAVEEAGDEAAVGEHLGVEAEGERLVLHRFASRSQAYRGWVWTVVTARAPRVRKVTVDDVVLTPGDDALLAPPWVPWSQRLRPGDVGVGDLLPTAVDDPRLTLRQADVEEFVDTDAFLELGLGRARVLSVLGREDASARWYAGEPGPDAHVAKVAPATCLTCGFHVRLAGALGRLFGVCANELAPDDARVTSIDHGCGAHSEALVAPSAHPESVPFDEDPSDLAPTDVELVGATASGAEPTHAGTHPSVGRPEPYGHA